MSKPVIGILVYRKGTKFPEPSFFRQLVREGQKLGALTYLFSPDDINLKARSIQGVVPARDGGWKVSQFPWPDVVIDRHRRSGAAYMRIRKSKYFLYANNRFTNKWNITRMFLEDEKIRRWMPETVQYSGDNLSSMLEKHSLLYIKPGNGTAGSSIVKLTDTGKGYEMLGRSRDLSKKRAVAKKLSSVKGWLDRWTVQERIRDGNFMIQQGLNLELVPERVTDTRLLIQKDEEGNWDVTGMGMRVGPKGSSTSNLHGGGSAVSFDELIVKKFGEQKAQEIRQECEELAFEVVKSIEKHFGSMMEFGLDIGIDVDGRVWLIEVNPKPGRDIFKGMGQMPLYNKAVRRPVEYALLLARRSRPKSS